MEIVAILTALALLVVFIGVRFAHRSNRPKLFRIGSMTAASGLMLLWMGVWWVFSADRGLWAMPMFIAALFVPVSLLGLGIQLMGRACGAREESHNEQLFREFLTRNDL
jgi:hypothetical protein